jgi:hypothetical protein
VVEQLPIVDRPPDEDAAAADRWDHASVHGFSGTYGDYLLAKVAKVFPALAAGGSPANPPGSASIRREHRNRSTPERGHE